MKKAKNIHNLDSLEKEIYRLKLEAKNIEGKLEQNFEHLQDNYYSMTMNSFFKKSERHHEAKSGFFDSFFKSESFNAAIHKATDHIASRAAESIEDLVDKIIDRKK